MCSNKAKWVLIRQIDNPRKGYDYTYAYVCQEHLRKMSLEFKNTDRHRIHHSNDIQCDYPQVEDGGNTMTALGWALAFLVVAALMRAFIMVYNWGYNDRIRDEIEGH